jgi:hypothetical protein
MGSGKRSGIISDEFEYDIILLINVFILTSASVVGKAVSSQSLNASNESGASSPEVPAANPPGAQPKLRKWFKHKEQLSGGGVSLQT